MGKTTIFERQLYNVGAFMAGRISGYAFAQDLFAGSTGISREDCARLPGSTFVAICIDGRYVVLAVHYTGDKYTTFAKSIEKPLFSFPYGGRFRNVCQMSEQGDDYWCVNCRRAVTPAHKCGQGECVICGNPIDGKTEAAAMKAYGKRFCAECARERLARRYGYHDKPVRVYVKADEDKREKIAHFGIEVELDSRRSIENWDAICGRLSEKLNTNPLAPSAYFNRDGSLNDGGVETITLPMTANELLALDWQGFCDTARESGLTASSHCGIHVHCDRAFLTEKSNNKAVLLFAYINRLQDEFERVFGRRMSFECDGGYNQKLEKTADVIDCAVKIYNSRYWAVNVQNGCTIELRTFASTTDADTLLAFIDTAQALFKWAKKATPAKAATSNFGAFCQYLKRADTLDYICDKVGTTTAAQCRTGWAHSHNGQRG